MSVVVTGNAVSVDDTHHELSDVSWSGSRLDCRVDGQWIRSQIIVDRKLIFVVRDGDTERLEIYEEDIDTLAHDASASDRITSPMPGQVVSLAVQVGDEVHEGDVLMVIEAMKMEHNINAPCRGKVSTIACKLGDRIEEGVELVTFEAG